MHVPKSAGSSLIAGLSGALQPRRHASGFDPVLFGAFDDFQSFDDATRKAIHLRPDSLPDADLVTGHFALSTLRARYPRAQILTVLREPASRLLSHWLFWRGHDEARLAEWGGWAGIVRLSRLPFADFLASRPLACQHDNLLARMLLWPHPLIPDDGFIDDRHDEALLDEARTRLTGLDFVGVVEERLFACVACWLGRPMAAPQRNETGRLPPPLQGRLEAELTPETFDRLDRLTRIDARLWRDWAMPGQLHEACLAARSRVFCRSVARYATLLAGI